TEAHSYQRVCQMYTMPVIYAPTGEPRAIRAMLPKTIRAALYVYNGGNDEFLKVRRMTHVWLHHGDSDKEACHRRKSANYDVLVVAGPGARERSPPPGGPLPSDK